MILSELNAVKDAFKHHLDQKERYADLYIYESIKTFQDNWNVDGPDFKGMYDRSLQNSVTQELWRGNHWAPKKAMMTFIDRDPDLMKMMFKELFNENLDLDGRTDRFLWHCDQIRDDMLRSDPRYRRHDHEGFKMISTYLALRYPETYAVYDYTPYRAFMDRVRTMNPPEPHEIHRYFKVVRSVWKIISRDEELLELDLRRRRSYPRLWTEESASLVWEMFHWYFSLIG